MLTRHLNRLLLFTVLFLGYQAAQAHPPTGIVVDRKGTVYFTDLETVWRLETSGKLSVFRPGVSGRHVHELALDKDDNLLGADISYESQKWISDVWKMTPAGEFTYLLEPTSNPARGISIWTDMYGYYYFVEQDNRTKKSTLLLRRTPDGQVVTLAGNGYGSRDGKGADASFGSVGGIFIAGDGTSYLTDGTSVRKVTSDGVVTTLAANLNKRTAEDIPPLFGKNDGILTGLSVDASGNVFIADAGNQRLLKIDSAGSVSVVYRGEPPYYPNGVATSPSGDLYVLEVGFKPPGTWLAARVRRITAAGSSIVAVSGEQRLGGGGGASEFKQYMIPGTVVRSVAGLLAIAAVFAVIGAWKLSGRYRGL